MPNCPSVYKFQCQATEVWSSKGDKLTNRLPRHNLLRTESTFQDCHNVSVFFCSACLAQPSQLYLSVHFSFSPTFSPISLILHQLSLFPPRSLSDSPLKVYIYLSFLFFRFPYSTLPHFILFYFILPSLIPS